MMIIDWKKGHLIPNIKKNITVSSLELQASVSQPNSGQQAAPSNKIEVKLYN